jgi:hypothetical protein
MHDTRLGRFFAVDPLTVLTSGETPYMFAGNSPIYLIDVEGLYRYPVTVNYNGHTYDLMFNSRNTQKVKIRLADDGVREGWQEVEFSTKDPRRIEMGLRSIGLMESGYADKLSTSGDANIMSERFFWINGGFSVEALEVIKAALNSDPNLGLTIIGGHAISGRPGTVRDPEGSPFMIENLLAFHGYTGLLLSSNRIYNNDSQFNPEFEKAFNNVRANTVKDNYFTGVSNVQAMSRQEYSGSTLGSVNLVMYNSDPVGITMSFNFDRPRRESPPQEDKTPTEKSKNPRFL